ncbi:MAG TPA: diguanylate cyclase [Pseudoneobacillus sp.]|nr:diguanylate cyclase [Pseudoneobacillus sp.]
MEKKRALQLNIYFFSCILCYLFLFFHFSFPINIHLWVIISTFAFLAAFFDTYPIVLPSGENMALVMPLFFTISTVYGEFAVLAVSAFMCTILCISIPKKFKSHLFNSVQYSIASLCGLKVYLLLGGIIGELDLNKSLPFLGYSVVYFCLNVILLVTYLVIAGRGITKDLLKVFVEKKNVLTYFTIMSFGLLMVIVYQQHGLTGLMLMSIIMWALGVSYRNYYKMFDHFRDLSTKDELTGLYNHRYFQETLKEQVDTKEVVSLLLLDLDYFKTYNDLFGHPKGDQLLKEVAMLLSLDCPKIGTICRYGGEEFAIILPNIESNEAIEIAEKIRTRVSNHPFSGKEHMPSKKVTVSIGVSTYPHTAEHKDSLIMHADQALYKIKYTSRNKVHLYSSVIDELKTSFTFENKEEDVLQTIKTFLTIINSKDRYTYAHTERIMGYAEELAKKIGLPEEEVKTVRYAALLHDIGKVEVPTDVLNKQAKLTNEEWETIKMHVIWGEEMVKPIKELSECLPIIRHHHERYDGKGYPDHLAGNNIPLLARILTVVDSFDAMTTNRPYQKVKSFKDACEELIKCKGTQFDPDIVDPFIQVISETHPEQFYQAPLTKAI